MTRRGTKSRKPQRRIAGGVTERERERGSRGNIWREELRRVKVFCQMVKI